MLDTRCQNFVNFLQHTLALFYYTHTNKLHVNKQLTSLAFNTQQNLCDHLLRLNKGVLAPAEYGLNKFLSRCPVELLVLGVVSETMLIKYSRELILNEQIHKSTFQNICNFIVKEKFSFRVILLKSQNQVSVFQMLLSTVMSNK